MKESASGTNSYPNIGRRCAAQTIVSRWIMETCFIPLLPRSGSTSHIPVFLFGNSLVNKNQCTRVQGYLMLLCENEKKSSTQATSRPPIPCRGISIDKNGVMAMSPFPPRIYCMYTFTTHTTDAQDLTWSVGRGDCRRIYGEFAIEHRRHWKADVRIVAI